VLALILLLSGIHVTAQAGQAAEAGPASGACWAPVPGSAESAAAASLRATLAAGNPWSGRQLETPRGVHDFRAVGRGVGVRGGPGVAEPELHSRIRSRRDAFGLAKSVSQLADPIQHVRGGGKNDAPLLSQAAGHRCAKRDWRFGVYSPAGAVAGGSNANLPSGPASSGTTSTTAFGLSGP
jgi:hypothetical protein